MDGFRAFFVVSEAGDFGGRPRVLVGLNAVAGALAGEAVVASLRGLCLGDERNFG